ncbi:hypothetical protein B0H12DRAFT_1232098 [Mycena haematopus]|nr:hypothetical protein B0H12DRAFT_1232098 [Mycena haematopus]
MNLLSSLANVACSSSEHAPMPPENHLPQEAQSPPLDTPRLNVAHSLPLFPLSVSFAPVSALPERRCTKSPPPFPVRRLDDECRQCASSDCPICGELDYDLFIESAVFDVTEEEAPTAAILALREDPKIRGDVLRSDCRLKSLLGGYMEGRDSRTGDHPERDLEALSSSLRRSARLAAAKLTRTPKPDSPDTNPKPIMPARGGQKRKREAAQPRPWLDSRGDLVAPHNAWHYELPHSLPTRTTTALPTIPHPESYQSHPTLSAPARSLSHPSLPVRPAASSLRHPILHPSLPARPTPVAEDRTAKRFRPRGFVTSQMKVERTLSRGEYVASSSFSLLRDASFSLTGWQGLSPSLEAREEIDKLYPNGLNPYLQYFFPCYYLLRDSIKEERSTFFVDAEGIIFMYRSYRIAVLMDAADEIEEAHNILVGTDRTDPACIAHYRGGQRGDHIAIIFGHHRQSTKQPRLTKWHLDNLDRVEEFMKLPIVGAMIGLVTDIVTLVFPGVAARFLSDADWHEKRYGIKPMFGLFWNLCLNAWFPGQRRIHCRPHADKKNQIGVCVLLIYVLKTHRAFDHTKYTWLVIWEAGVAVELPPWTILIYPSALFYHFNIDVHDLKFVTTDGLVRPTPANSRPIVDGDDQGRGSFVIFNQSTMRTGPATGFDTLKEAKEAGHSGYTDFGKSAQEAFSRHAYFHKIPDQTPV